MSNALYMSDAFVAWRSKGGTPPDRGQAVARCDLVTRRGRLLCRHRLRSGVDDRPSKNVQLSYPGKVKASLLSESHFLSRVETMVSPPVSNRGS